MPSLSMDLSFCTTNNALIPSVFSPSFHLQSLSRREFLGCGLHMRPPSIRCRTERKKPGPRCLIFLDSLYDNSVLVIAATVAVFAAIELVHPNRNRGGDCNNVISNDTSEKELSVAFTCGKLSGDTEIPQEECIGMHVIASETLCTLPSFFDKTNITSRTPEESYSTDDDSSISNDGKLCNHTSVLTEDLSNNELHLVDDSLALLPTERMLDKIKVDRANELLLGEIESLEKLVLDNSDFIIEKEEETLPVNNGHPLKVFRISNCLMIPVQSKQRDFSQSQYYRTQQHMADERVLLDSNYNEDYCRSTKEAYDCSEEQLEVRSISCFNSLNEEPLNLVLRSNGGYHDLKKFMKKAEVLENKAKSDVTERPTLVMCLKKSFGVNEKGQSKRRSSIHEIDRSFLWRKVNKHSSSFRPNGGLVKDSSNLETCLRSYECFLRDARLKDCLDLLDSMERKGILDMDKVHHSRFLNACKSHKAVIEAFHFCKLINKPTQSLFNMLLSVCANSQDFDGAFKVMLLMKEARLKPDCKLYTTLISACGKCEKVDAMFEVFHEMVNSGIEPNANTYGALIDGCARSGQVAKAFGAYGIMRSKNVQPDRVVFNALITACGRSGALDRAFDVLAEMTSEPKPIEPDHITIGALVRACIQAGQANRAREVYRMLHLYNIKGTPDVYTIAVNSCSQNGDLDFALTIYDDMKRNGVEPDEMFLSTIIDAAGHAQNVDAAFAILKDARTRGMHVGRMTYSSLMGACCNAKNWNKALELYEDIKAIKLLPTVSTLNALVTALCDGDQLLRSAEVLDEMKEAGVMPNIITYSILIVACEKKDEAYLGFVLLSKAKMDGILPNLIMCRCLTGLCLRSYEKACSFGEPIVSFNSGNPQIDSIWTSRAIMVYRETISSGEIPTIEVFSQVLGCLQFPRDSLLRNSFIENLGINFSASRWPNISSYLHGFGEYDTRSFSVIEEAASLGVVPRVSFKESPIVLDARKLLIHTVEVYILTMLKGLKHRLAAGARLPCITILLAKGKTVIGSPKGERTVYIAGRNLSVTWGKSFLLASGLTVFRNFLYREFMSIYPYMLLVGPMFQMVGQAVGSLLRRLGLPYQGDESYGKIRINGLALRRWFKPKIMSFSVTGRPGDIIPPSARLAKGLADQQRSIRSSSLSLE